MVGVALAVVLGGLVVVGIRELRGGSRASSSSSSTCTTYRVTVSVLVKIGRFLALRDGGVEAERLVVGLLLLEGSGGIDLPPSEVSVMVDDENSLK